MSPTPAPLWSGDTNNKWEDDFRSGLSRRWEGAVKWEKKKTETSKFCEVWCKGRGSSIWEVPSPGLWICALKCYLFGIRSVSYSPCWALGTQWGVGVGEELTSAQPLPFPRQRLELPPSAGKWGDQPQTEVFPASELTVSLLFWNLCCGFVFIFTFNHG